VSEGEGAIFGDAMAVEGTTGKVPPLLAFVFFFFIPRERKRERCI
jgi:hypothetical protein